MKTPFVPALFKRGVELYQEWNLTEQSYKLFSVKGMRIHLTPVYESPQLENTSPTYST